MKIFKIYPLYSNACGRAKNIEGFLFNMKEYKIKSPSKRIFTVFAETIYHACNIVRSSESYQFTNVEYLKLNK